MAKEEIFTKLHKAIERSTPEVKLKLEQFAQFPHYVFQFDIFNMADNEQTIKTLSAAYDCGLLKLPYPKMFVELWKDWSAGRNFLLIEENPTDSSEYRGELIAYSSDVNATNNFGAFSFKFEKSSDGYVWIVTNLPAVVSAVTSRDGSKAFDEYFDEYIHLIIGGIHAAFLVPIINGFERKVIEPKGLNKARKLSGKVGINTHTIVRLGHVYDRKGNKHSVNSPEGRKMSVHLRAGHVRYQPHGMPWIKANPEEANKTGNTETHHRIFVEPILVNFKDGDEQPTPRPKLVKY